MQELKERHRHVMQAMLMDVLRALATPNMDIRKKTLDIALDLITQQNIDEVRTFPLRPLGEHEWGPVAKHLSVPVKDQCYFKSSATSQILRSCH